MRQLFIHDVVQNVLAYLCCDMRALKGSESQVDNKEVFEIYGPESKGFFRSTYCKTELKHT